MCGLTGILCDAARPPVPLDTTVDAMASAMLHRGPDDGGRWLDPEGGLALGFRRLAILDLSPAGHQPMVSADGRFAITFNGEIFNHGRVRAELAALGHRFRGHSDTEVLLAAFAQWGVRETIPRLVGMFAIALWDRQRRRLFLVRDRFGKKPLFVYHRPGLVLWGSELKSLMACPAFPRVVDLDAMRAFLGQAYVPAPRSIFRHTIKLPPASLLEIADPHAPLPAPEVYWDPRALATEGITSRITDAREAEEACAELLDDAVRLRMEADVPLGALLSGGIDSSLVVARMQALSPAPVHTFTIGFDRPEWDESAHSAAVAAHLGTSHTTLHVTGADALAVLPDLPTIFDEPMADPSQIPTILVCRLARRGVTVALCGDGGDELFGGYNRYVDGPRAIAQALRVPGLLRRPVAAALLSVSADRWERLAARLIPAGRRPRILGEKLQKLAVLLRQASPAGAYRSLLSAMPEPGRLVRGGQSLPSVTDDVLNGMPNGMPNGMQALSLPERMMLADQLDYLPDDLLAKMDRASMSASLEVRAPLLDHRLAALAWRLDPSLKIRDGRTKWILRRLLARDVPPALFERPKMGFSVPVRAWLTGPLRPWAEDLLSVESLRRIPALDPSAVQRAWRDLLAGRAGNGVGIWAVLHLVAWWRRWEPTDVQHAGP